MLAKEHSKSDLELTIDNIWPMLTRKHKNDSSTLIGLPNPYIVPSISRGNEFEFNEFYYWDSYFVALALVEDRHKRLVEGMLENLLALYKRFGMIPNASRFYMTSRSQPPILSSFIFLVYDRYGKSQSWLSKKMAVAMGEYQTVWASNVHPHWRNVFRGLSRYYDINMLHDLAEAESGWDMTTRFDRKCLDFLPIDLNSLLYKYEVDFARFCSIIGDVNYSQYWSEKASARKAVIDELMWANYRGFYFDYNYVDQKQSSVWSLAAYYPMWVGMASNEQATRLAENINKFEKSGGLTTTARQLLDSKVIFGSMKAQWSYPNGWAPLHLIVTEGLERYGYHEAASRIRHKWIYTVSNWYNKYGVFLEKYNVSTPVNRPHDGLYPTQEGFAWTNAVTAIFLSKIR